MSRSFFFINFKLLLNLSLEEKKLTTNFNEYEKEN
jgi:hypothetical protein